MTRSLPTSHMVLEHKRVFWFLLYPILSSLHCGQGFLRVLQETHPPLSPFRPKPYQFPASVRVFGFWSIHISPCFGSANTHHRLLLTRRLCWCRHDYLSPGSITTSIILLLDAYLDATPFLHPFAKFGSSSVVAMLFILSALCPPLWSILCSLRVNYII